MKLVAKYTLVVVAALSVAVALLAIEQVRRDRGHFEDDMSVDHRVVGHVLQANVIDLWREVSPDGRGAARDDPDRPGDRDARMARTLRLIARANEASGPARFEWLDGAISGGEVQGVVGHAFVSRFPVRVGGRVIGAVVIRESLDDTDRLVHQGVVFSALTVAIIIAVSFTASLVLGRWLVGQPIRALVDKARRVGHRDFAGAVELGQRDELGELAGAMNAMSAELAQALAQIAVETEARIRAVEHMRHADRLSTVGKLAAGIAHELGTPLSIVGGHAQMIAAREVTSEAAIDSARAIDREAARMGRIVRQLLDFARRRKHAEGETSDPRRVVERCLSLLAPLAAQGSVAVETAFPAEPLRARIDEDNLQQVLTNLIVNGLQAMPDGGRLVVSAHRERAAPVDALGAPSSPGAPPRDCVRIDVGDTGRGIPDDVRAHVFEPFFTTKPPGEGTGLGLAVVYGIVDDHEGWIAIHTSPRGTTMSVFLHEVSA